MMTKSGLENNGRVDDCGLDESTRGGTSFGNLGRLAALVWVASALCNVALLGANLITHRRLTAQKQLYEEASRLDFRLVDDKDTRQLQTIADVTEADVTVFVDEMAYHGNDHHAPGRVHRNEEGCIVYEQFRQDGKEGRVTCCGEGDCLLGFLTQHQWLFSWL